MVATDTLATSHEGKPTFFTSKVLILPHLKMLVAGTGIAGFVDKWFVGINASAIQGIDHLDEHAARYLAAMWGTYKSEVTISQNFTTTVYHFGFSERTNLIHSYAYRSENDFRSERLAYGVAVKPECKVPDFYNFPQDMRTMMEEQRQTQQARPKDKRVYIGGEILIHHLTSDGFNVYPLGCFDDFEADKSSIFKKS